MTFQIVLFAAVIAGVAAAAWYGRKLERERTAAMAQVAAAMKFNFYETGTPDLTAGFSDLPLLNHGRSRRWRNVLVGAVAEQQAIVGDYYYVTGSGKNSHRWNQTVVVFPQGGKGLPVFTLAPEHFFHKIGSLFGYQDIDFEASPEFSKHYLLRGTGESAIRSAFTADALAYFGQNPGWSVQSCGGGLAMFRLDKVCKPEEAPAFLAEALRNQGMFARSGAGA